MVEFTKELIKEYQQEMLISYGLSVSDSQAQIQLLSLTRFLFPTPAFMAGVEDEVGDSITPTSGQNKNDERRKYKK